MFNIRRARHDDAMAIITTHVRSIREVCGPDYTTTEIEAWAGRNQKPDLWRQAIDRDLIWVVEWNGAVHGFGHLAIMDADTAEVMGLYFTPELKGHGAGKALMQILKTEAQNRGAKKLHLHSTKTARTFYEGLGFTRAPGKCSVEMRGVDIPCYPMECKLS